MSKKSFFLSSAGLKNLVPYISNEKNEFRFIFSDHEIRLNRISAEFISPPVSRLHYSDPTIDFIRYDEIFEDSEKERSKRYNQIFTEDIISLLYQISSGYSIELDEEQSIKMRFISLLLGNDELFAKLDELFPLENIESNFESYIDQLQLFQCFSQLSRDFNYSSIIDNISSHFYSIEKKKLLKLPKSILYSIISNTNLKIQSEDSLLDFIEEIFTRRENENDEDDEYNITLFYETIEFYGLTENKFFEFIQKLNSTDISYEIWNKLKECFYIDSYSLSGLNKERYAYRSFEYDEDDDDRLNGIIHFLRGKSSYGEIEVTSSSTYSDRYPENVVNFDDDKKYFMSDDQKNSWVKIDFKEKKVRPNFYTIQSRNGYERGCHHLKNWCIEGSNTNLDDDWKILDERNRISCLDDSSAIHTFEIKTKLKKDECFRFLRLRETGVNTGGHYHLTLSALEFFGFLI